MSTGAAVTRPSSAGRGAATSKGQQGPARPLHLGQFLPPFLALGFSDGYEACPAPPPPGSLSLVFQQDWAGPPFSYPPGPRWPPAWGPVTTGLPQLPQMPPGTRSWVPSPQPSTLAPGGHPWFSRLPVPTVLFAFLLPHVPTPKPQNNFSLYKQI